MTCSRIPWAAQARVAGLLTGLAAAALLGAEPLRLTHDGIVKTDPVFSDRQGAELVYVVNDTPTRMRLMRLRLGDLSVAPLHPEETRAEFEPAFSADGRWIAFVQSRGNLSLALVVRETLGGKESSAVLGGGFAGLRAPSFSPDSTRVTYSFPENGRQQIYTCDLALNDRRVLVDSDGVNNWPSWSPDGKRLLFASSRDNDFELYVADADGGQPRRLTRSPRQDIRPRWSPDGSRIAFTSGRDGNYEIYVMSADGGDPRRITNHPERDDYPTWHPDGKHLVFVGERDGRHDLFQIEVP